MRYAADITFPGHWIDIRRFHGGVEPCSRLLLLHTCHFMSQRIPLEEGKIEKERKREGNMRLFIYLFIYDRDIRGLIPRAKTCREAIPRWPLEFHRFYTITRASRYFGKKKKGGGKKREHPRRGEGLTNSTWLRPAIYSRFKGCAGEFYYSAAEFANLFNDLFAMTNSK